VNGEQADAKTGTGFDRSLKEIIAPPALGEIRRLMPPASLRVGLVAFRTERGIDHGMLSTPT
jgi:hypothetical protein